MHSSPFDLSHFLPSFLCLVLLTQSDSHRNCDRMIQHGTEAAEWSDTPLLQRGLPRPPPEIGCRLERPHRHVLQARKDGGFQMVSVEGRFLQFAQRDRADHLQEKRIPLRLPTVILILLMNEVHQVDQPRPGPPHRRVFRRPLGGEEGCICTNLQERLRRLQRLLEPRLPLRGFQLSVSAIVKFLCRPVQESQRKGTSPKRDF
mmetsp:Transcript_7214/g.14147  ORF Transcript_7214/g.14147 Transcript_7214/m.14147 type:complete len:203 (-) Transcript_7214:154-762(-)